jgi:hypothetical protein
MSNLSNNNNKDYCFKNEKEIKDLNIKEQATKNYPEIRKNSTAVDKKFIKKNSFVSKKKFMKIIKFTK